MEQLVSSYPGAHAPGQIKKKKKKASSRKPQAASFKRQAPRKEHN